MMIVHMEEYMDGRSQSQSGRPLRCAVHPPIWSSAPKMANQSDDKDINFEIFEIVAAADDYKDADVDADNDDDDDDDTPKLY